MLQACDTRLLRVMTDCFHIKQPECYLAANQALVISQQPLNKYGGLKYILVSQLHWMLALSTAVTMSAQRWYRRCSSTRQPRCTQS